METLTRSVLMAGIGFFLVACSTNESVRKLNRKAIADTRTISKDLKDYSEARNKTYVAIQELMVERRSKEMEIERNLYYTEQASRLAGNEEFEKRFKEIVEASDNEIVLIRKHDAEIQALKKTFQEGQKKLSIPQEELKAFSKELGKLEEELTPEEWARFYLKFASETATAVETEQKKRAQEKPSVVSKPVATKK